MKRQQLANKLLKLTSVACPDGPRSPLKRPVGQRMFFISQSLKFRLVSQQRIDIENR